MERFEHGKIEQKWQKRWKESGIYTASEQSDREKKYVLDMFPYPSGEGLHVGHPKGYIATDIYSRMKRMQGYEVLHPMGWDAFGLPAENFALKHKVHPRVAVEKNIATFKAQLEKIGFNYDWSREINTTDPEYYKWTQWIFLKLLEHGLAYQSNEPINWCPSCMTGLANEDLDGAVCERCGTPVEKKELPQWVLKITDYADRMLADLDGLNWPEYIKEAQRNWIGRSEGAKLRFPIATANKKYVMLHGFCGSPTDGYFPWLKQILEAQGAEVITPALPQPKEPNEQDWVSAARAATAYDENTVLFGWSLGAVTALKVAEQLRSPIAKLVLAGGFVDPEFKDSPRNFEKTFSWHFDWKKIRANVGEIVILHDVNDPAVSAEQADRMEKASGIPVRRVVAQDGHFDGDQEPEVLSALLSESDKTVEVFTTRPDTLYGVTYVVLAPEHALVSELLSSVSNKEEVRAYVEATKRKTDRQRSENKEKTGVELKGVLVKNPVNGQAIPVYVADYVLGSYGTGAVMAVPAHDERDFEFAQKHGLQIRHVIAPRRYDASHPHQEGKELVERDATISIVHDPKTDRYLCLKWKKFPWTTFVTGGVEKGEQAVDSAKREIAEETGYQHVEYVRTLGKMRSEFFAAHKDVNRVAFNTVLLFTLTDDAREGVTDEELAKHESVWLTSDELRATKLEHSETADLLGQLFAPTAVTEDGVLVDSAEFSGRDNREAMWDIVAKAGGERTTQYKIKDWVFSRQRYWGEPIPVIHCPTDGAVPVPYEDLPVRLPEVDHYEPTGTGESPLAAISDWVNVNCPKCGGPAKRETNTMPQWAGSSWYYLRFMDPHDSEHLVSPKREKYWAPVDVYVGGDHAVRHLIYARFWHKFLYDIAVVSTTEPFARLEFLGFILAEDGRKMSKRYGNVINPDDVVAEHGADAFRTYEMFMGPFENTTAWNTASISGTARFIERLWQVQELVADTTPETLVPIIHQTIKKVTEDIERFKFNTAVSQFMIALNAIEAAGAIGAAEWNMLIRLTAPFTPHLSEELWERAGETFSVHTAAWPAFDPTHLREESVLVVVQVNGKLRGEVRLALDAAEAEAVAEARKLAPVEAALGGKDPARVVYVPGKILNLVAGRGTY